jgi:urease gamma subunit
MKYTKEEIEQGYRDVESVVGSFRIEGIEPDARTVADLMAVARGEMTTDEVRAGVFARIKSGELFTDNND